MLNVECSPPPCPASVSFHRKSSLQQPRGCQNSLEMSPTCLPKNRSALCGRLLRNGDDWRRSADAPLRFKPRRFQESSRQVAMTVQGAPHHRVPRCLIEKDVLLKRTARDDKAPVAQAGMGETATRAKQRMPCQQQAGGFDGSEIAFGDVPAAFTAYHSNCRSTSARKSSDLSRLMRRGNSGVSGRAGEGRQSPRE